MALLLPMTGGCVASKAVSLATAPVRVASGTYDHLTVSQSERDERRGREMRHREERLSKLDKQYRKAEAKCESGDRDACEDAEAIQREIDQMGPAGSR